MRASTSSRTTFLRGLTGGLVLLLVGGLCYSLGVIFYVWKTLVYHHAIWHLFVLAGSTFHFFAVLFYVIPNGSAAYYL